MPLAPSYTRRRKLTPQQWDEIRERYNDGEEVQALAREFGVSANGIRERLGRRT